VTPKHVTGSRVLKDICRLADFEPLARKKLTPMAYEYIAGGAGDEVTMRANIEAFDAIRLMPRILTDVSRVDTCTELFGQELPFPILLAPAAYHRLLHPEGELETARGASFAGAILVVSSFATTAIEEIASEAKQPLWFQLYVQRDRGFTRVMVERALAAGSRALCVTVDTPVIGVRHRERRTNFCLPGGLDCPMLKGLGNKELRTMHRPDASAVYSPVFDPAFTWKDVEWLCSFSSVPVVLKGVLNPEDAHRAASSGAAGIIVSNHGGRNLDTAPATIDVLPAVAERVADRIPVLLDGGIRRGTDVAKALALGARAVLIGRPYLYALAVAGSEGVRSCISLLHTELQMTMALLGRPTLAQIDRSVIFIK
jgi:4-hydroxymandelate oxidase